MNIDLGLTSWHNNVVPLSTSPEVGKSQKSLDSFTGNEYLGSRKKKRKYAKDYTPYPAVLCNFSNNNPVFMKKIPLTYDRFGNIRYMYEFSE